MDVNEREERESERSRVRVMGLAYAVGSQRFRPWNSGMDLALCTSHRVGVTCCHFISRIRRRVYMFR